jgi:hypothetical protein
MHGVEADDVRQRLVAGIWIEEHAICRAKVKTSATRSQCLGESTLGERPTLRGRAHGPCGSAVDWEQRGVRLIVKEPRHNVLVLRLRQAACAAGESEPLSHTHESMTHHPAVLKPQPHDTCTAVRTKKKPLPPAAITHGWTHLYTRHPDGFSILKPWTSNR